MKIIRTSIKWILYILLLPVGYVLVSLTLSAIPVQRISDAQDFDHTIYLSSNGVHLDIILSREDLSDKLLRGLENHPSEDYFSFGWGDENFYINTPTWADLTLANAFSAMFLKSNSLMHVSRYKARYKHWLPIQVTDVELQKLHTYLQAAFQTTNEGNKILLENKGYGASDDFYKAYGSYSCFNTCNSWVNSGFKQSGLKACLWTPFDVGLLGKYDGDASKDN